MTDQFKQRIIEYLTGNYQEYEPSDELIFTDIKKITNNIYTILNNKFYEHTNIDYIQGKDKNNNDLSVGVIYGYYKNSVDDNEKGYIVIVDNDFNVLEIITEYSNGTKFARFEILNIDEKGQLYGIDNGATNNDYRFILLNNFFIKLESQEYKVKLKNSYYMDSFFSKTNYRIENISKSSTSSKYVVIGSKTVSLLPYVLTYTINVGSENEHNIYEYTLASGESLHYSFRSSLIQFDNEDKVNIVMAGVNDVEGQDSRFDTYEYTEILFSNETFTKKRFQNIELNPYEISYDINFSNANLKYMLIIKREVIYPQGEIKAEYTINKFDSSVDISLVEIYKFINNEDGTITNNIAWGNIRRIGSQIFFYYIYKKRNENNKYIYGIANGRVINNKVYKIDNEITLDQELTQNNVVENVFFYISSIYNLYTFTTQVFDDNYKVMNVYNQFNYNFKDYQALNSMVPRSAMLYDENNEIIFARNLYNRTSFGDTTLSVVELPNTLLNNINITKQELLSETNSTLIENLQTIITNIYETLNINFYNKLSVQNRNVQEDIKNNVDGATRLNLSISQELDYEDNMIKKYKVIFDDETFKIYNLSIPEQVNEKKYRYRFSVYVPINKNITNIQLLSNDESTIYQDITNIELENNKFYTLTQDVEII